MTTSPLRASHLPAQPLSRSAIPTCYPYVHPPDIPAPNLLQGRRRIWDMIEPFFILSITPFQCSCMQAKIFGLVMHITQHSSGKHPGAYSPPRVCQPVQSEEVIIRKFIHETNHPTRAKYAMDEPNQESLLFSIRPMRVHQNPHPTPPMHLSSRV